MPNKVNIHVGAPGAKETQREIEATTREVKEFGDVTAEAGKKGGKGFKDVDQESQKTKKGLGGIVTAADAMKAGVIAAIMAVIEVYKLWHDYLKKIADAQKEIAEGSKGLDQAAKALASQAGVMGTQEGMSGSREQIRKIQKGGNLDSYEMAEAVAVSTHSAFGTTGQLLTDQQMGVAKSLADFARRKDIDAGGVDDLLKVMAKVGEATGQPVDEAFAQEFIQKISTVQQSSKIKSFKQFMPGAIKAVMSTMAYGGTVDMALGQYSSALDVEASADLAASQVEKVNAMMLNPKVAQAIGGGFADMPYDQKITAFSAWASENVGTSAGQNKLLGSGISADQLGVLTKLYNQGQIGRVEFFRGLAGQGTAAQFRAASEGYRGTVQGMIESYDAQELDRKASASQAERLGNVMISNAEAEWLNINARGENNPLLPDWIEQGRKTLADPFKARIEQLRRAGVDVGDLPSEVWDVDKWSWDAIAPKDVGEIELRLRELEATQNRPIVNVTNITNPTYHVPRQGMEGQQGYPHDPNSPRVAF